MGHKLSSLCISGDDDDNNDDSFQEVQRRKTRDGGGDRARRKSSGLSRYSNDFQHTIEEPLKIAAFNVRRFGAAKMKQNVVVDILVKIIKQFDIIIVQEVVDSSEKAVHDLLEAVNSSDDKYQMVLSPRLGRNTQKEQYVIIFRSSKVSVTDSCVYPDPGDVFIREPFIVRFSSNVVENIESFTLIAIHTQPKNAAMEIDSLVDVHDWVRRRMKTEDIMIAGDLNAGGQFIRQSDWAKCRLRQAGYTWLIPDHVDTTASNTLAAYDRIIVCSDSLNSCIVPNSSGVYRFDEELSLDESTTLQVSDHYPVYCTLKPRIHQKILKNILSKHAIYIIDKRLPIYDFKTLLLEDNFNVPKLKIRGFYEKGGSEVSLVEIRYSSNIRRTVLTFLSV